MTGPLPVTNKIFYVRENQDWQVQQERYRHEQPILRYGELVLFYLMWHVEDFEADLVQRCPRCSTARTQDARFGMAYNQAVQTDCPYCYGTTFDGGIRARLVRPAIIGDVDDDEVPNQRGVVHSGIVRVQTTEDFRSRSGDYMIRKDNSRWRLNRPQRTQIRTGFNFPTQANNSIGYGSITANLEDDTSVAKILPPSDDQTVSRLLTQTGAFFPNENHDIINGPLIPKSKIA